MRANTLIYETHVTNSIRYRGICVVYHENQYRGDLTVKIQIGINPLAATWPRVICPFKPYIC